MSEGGEGGEGGEGRGFWWKVFHPSLYRQGRQADLTNIPVSKLQEAAERGVRVDITSSKKGEVRGNINKIAVKGDDES